MAKVNKVKVKAAAATLVRAAEARKARADAAVQVHAAAVIKKAKKAKSHVQRTPRDEVNGGFFNRNGVPERRTPLIPIGVCIKMANVNFKGGSGKTTSVYKYALLAGAMGFRVLLVDLDPQCNLTTRLGFEPDVDAEGRSAYHALHDTHQTWNPQMVRDQVVSVKAWGSGRVDLLPGSRQMGEAFVILTGRCADDAEVPHRLKIALDDLESYYDLILFDSSPGLNGMAVDMLMNAVDVINSPLDGLDALSGACILIQKVSVQNKKRDLEGRAALKIFITVPHYTTERGVKYGTAEVANATFYPLGYKAFPLHFMRNAVKHSVGISRWDASPANRREYKSLFLELFKAIGDDSLVPLTEWIEETGFDLKAFRKQVNKLTSQRKEKVAVKRVKFL